MILSLCIFLGNSKNVKDVIESSKKKIPRINSKILVIWLGMSTYLRSRRILAVHQVEKAWLWGGCGTTLW